jgi:surface polysaccharide O-acyltransferase-like enzyme
MDEFQIIMVFWGVIVLILVTAQYYFLYALKKHETDLWESFGKPSVLNANGYFKSIWYVLIGKYIESSNEAFIKSCKFYRMAMALFVIGGFIVFGLWPMTWNSQ